VPIDAPSLNTRIEWLEETTSTNAIAAERAGQGERGPLWIGTRRQSAGRGRRGRAWTGLDGNLFATGLYTLNTTPAAAAELSFATAIAVAQVCDSALRDPVAIKVKWPNDILLNGRKLAGILLESGKAPGGGLWLAVGVGLNLKSAPQDVERAATSLAEAGATLDRETALQRLAAIFDRQLADWRRHGFGPIRDRWLARAAGLGERCVAQLDRERIEGIFGDLGPDGALRLDLASGERRYISAGDVFFPDL